MKGGFIMQKLRYLSPFGIVVLIALFCVCLVGFMQYRFNTNPKTAQRMETYAGMYIVAFDITLAIAIADMYGLDLGVLGTIGI